VGAFFFCFDHFSMILEQVRVAAILLTQPPQKHWAAHPAWFEHKKSHGRSGLCRRPNRSKRLLQHNSRNGCRLIQMRPTILFSFFWL
jgi:hypothetical protein